MLTDPEPISIVDLFSGCGGMSIGALEGARRAGRGARVSLAADLEHDPLAVLRASLKLPSDVTKQVDLGELLAVPGEPIGQAEKDFFARVASPAVLVAGPPCQGHSTLNNHTRHDDPRNDLYLAVARAVEILRPKLAIVENVRGVGSDRRGAMARCVDHLKKLGYFVEPRRVDLHRIGVPQKRVRHVLVAALEGSFEWDVQEHPGRSVAWAIDDLRKRNSNGPADVPAKTSATNRERIDWLFDNEAFDLPNKLRPECHRSDHSYVSMYGRLRWDAPAQTITSGFGSMGQGRYVHPKERRTLTPHEAARLQFLPDFVRLDVVSRRTALADMIGNVAPPALTIAIVEAAIAQRLI